MKELLKAKQREHDEREETLDVISELMPDLLVSLTFFL